jgi:hypothetical protein
VLQQVDDRLKDAEGHGLEKLVGQLYEERRRKGAGDFSLTACIQGYWDRGGTEFDLVALDEDSRRLRMGTCKRSPERLVADLRNFDGHVARFIKDQRRFQSWKVEKVAVAPALSQPERAAIETRGYIPQDLTDLAQGI